ncbi:hypothetical protein [uncultured Bradyrhizobium sp.]|jgi:hypothetical protein|uniref:hypothetical protein n=1 Tax=uncultured Bradyrhizobium sp. TaxID=199684 RepID=UPI0026148099|nr:hypothetical protein [uncultured Bradyrhizobium sp.]
MKVHQSSSRLPATSGKPTKSKRRDRWPFKAETCSPLTWWRQLPPDAFGEPECLQLLNVIGGIDVLRGGADLAAALRGDATAAIDAAVHLIPVEEITLPVDITMTALVCAVLDDNASAALVMAQVIGLTCLGHEREVELAASWLAYGRRCSAEPDKFGDAEAVLMAAFEETRRKGSGR